MSEMSTKHDDKLETFSLKEYLTMLIDHDPQAARVVMAELLKQTSMTGFAESRISCGSCGSADIRIPGVYDVMQLNGTSDATSEDSVELEQAFRAFRESTCALEEKLDRLERRFSRVVRDFAQAVTHSPYAAELFGSVTCRQMVAIGSAHLSLVNCSPA